MTDKSQRVQDQAIANGVARIGMATAMGLGVTLLASIRAKS